MKKRIFAACAVVLVLASACGGGDDTKASSLAFNMDAAMTNVLTSGVNFNGLTASVPIPASNPARSTNYGLAFSYSPAADGVLTLLGATSFRYAFSDVAIALPSGSFKRAVQTVTATKDGTPLSVTSATHFFRVGPSQLIASTLPNGSVAFYESTIGLPTAATVGQTGTYNTAKTNSADQVLEVIDTHGTFDFSDDTLVRTAILTPVDTTITIWSLEPDTETTAWACFATTTSAATTGGTTTAGSATALSSQKFCYRITPAGAITGAKATITVDGQTLTFRSGG